MVGLNDVAAIRDVTVLLRSLDNRFGGGRSRPTVIQYLVDEVTPLLRYGRYSDEIGAQLFSAAAELSHLAGWMAYDMEQHGLAQRYLIQALGLARAGGDYAFGGEILAGMSHQAAYVGRPGDAVDLARAARITARRARLAALEAEAVVMEAHAHALRGDRRLSTLALGAAEGTFDRVNDDVPAWLTYFDTAYLAARMSACLLALDELEPAEGHARRSLDMADGYARGRMFNVALLARIHARQGHVEQACEEGHRAVALASPLHSARTGHYLRELRLELRPHRDAPAVREFSAAARRRLPSPTPMSGRAQRTPP